MTAGIIIGIPDSKVELFQLFEPFKQKNPPRLNREGFFIIDYSISS